MAGVAFTSEQWNELDDDLREKLEDEFDVVYDESDYFVGSKMRWGDDDGVQEYGSIEDHIKNIKETEVALKEVLGEDTKANIFCGTYPC